MDEEFIKHVLATIPGAKRAARGVLIPVGDDQYFHIFNKFNIKDYKGFTPEELFFAGFCSKKEILRLRNLRSANDYLLKIRANSIVDNPRMTRVFYERRERYENSGRAWSLTHYYHLKDHYQKSYIKRLQRADAKKVRGIPSGMAMIQEANALSIKSLLGNVVVVSEGLEHFFYFMNIGAYGHQLGIKLIDRIHALLIATRIMIGSETLDFDLDPRGSIPPETERAIWEIVSWQMEFTFGHEYAHHICGHSSTPDNTSHILFSHQNEFEADIQAVKSIPLNNSGYVNIFKAAVSVLMFLSFLEKSLHQLTSTKLSVSDTHPPSEERMLNLWRGLGRHATFSQAKLEMSIDDASELTSLIREYLKNKPSDTLSIYGSIYLPSYTKRPPKDRIEI